MEVKCELITDKNLLFLYFYNESLQSLVYKYIFPEKRDFLHVQRYQYKEHKFKLSAFSNILQKPKFLNHIRMFNFEKKILFIISSAFSRILKERAENLIKTNEKGIKYAKNLLIKNIHQNGT